MDSFLMDLVKNEILDINSLKNLIEKYRTENKYPNLLNEIFEHNLIDKNNLIKYIAENIINKTYNIKILSKIYFISENEILEEISDQLHLPFLNLNNIDFDYSFAKKFSIEFLKAHQIMPIREDTMNFFVAFSDPLETNFEEKLRLIQNKYKLKQIQIIVSAKEQIGEHIKKIEFEQKVNKLTKNIIEKIENENIEQDSSAILDLINVILNTAIEHNSSDIHIEPTENNCLIRTRIDGKLQQIFKFQKNIFPPLSSRIKLLANMDIAEKRIPQDGRFSKNIILNKKNINYDFRVSSLPTVYGESIVIRVLDKNSNFLNLKNLGMRPLNNKKLINILEAPYGIILITGPTGSGKTTTLYGSLNHIKSTEEKIITIEDPIEYKINLVSQVQVNKKAGLDFSSTLKAVLRQDPDKIMIGEIRDSETLRIAVQSALTGHLVLSTLHTNDAVSAIIRMIDLGIESYLLGGAVVGVVAQRLVRKLCNNCKTELNYEESRVQEVIDSNKLSISFDDKMHKLYEPKGCSECSYTGFRGREIICEVLQINEEIESLITRNASKIQIYDKARENDFVNMLETGLFKVFNGITTLEEVLKVTKI
jgi:general secretion pathway protein E